MKRATILAASFLLILIFSCLAQDTKVRSEQQQLAGPENPSGFPAWLADIRHWREERLSRIGYQSREYERDEFKWTQRNFIQPQMMVEERYFYDPVAGKYTVERYLDDLEQRYGGIDSVLIWAVYCNIGIDNRNQHDMVRSLPGGIPVLKKMIQDFHRRGVKVLFPIMPWDRGTRDEGVPLWESIAKLLQEIGADGINGDTFSGIPLAFRKASDQTGHSLVLEPEVGLTSEEELAWNSMTWGYWKYPSIPMVSKYKWLEPRHMVHVCDRWARDKTDNLQFAFFNGTGYESWENVWGIWNQITPRDAESLRRIAKIERAFAEFLISPDWEPHTPTLQSGVYASKFPQAQNTFWSFVNRNHYDLSGRQIELRHKPEMKYFDVYRGVELKPEIQGESAFLSFDLEASGYGALFATQADLPATLQPLLKGMKELTQRPLQSYSQQWDFLPQKMVEIPATRPPRMDPPGMVLIPAAAAYSFRVSGIEIEGGNENWVDVQYPWENSPRRHHLKTMPIKSFYIDRFPVTNKAFKKFLDETQYQPKDQSNFLKDWKNGSFPEGWDNKPVTWISLEDARAYSSWCGKRLPHEWEWQYAAQGTDGRLYPWGNEWKEEAVPVPDKGRNMRPPDDVKAHPSGASPFGVMDMTGNIWQWTDAYQDEHTRAAILRGGSYYQPQGSMWYFPQAYKLTEHGKYLLMAPSKDRSGTLGFRCVVDAE
jgi:gamma-glutamyl hercynylcysteine S-oxide synthase